MDLRNKRIIGIAHIILLAMMLVLYTRIGGMGMIYVAGSMELFFVITYFFLGGIPETIEYMILSRDRKELRKDACNVWKAGGIYGVFASIAAEAVLFLADRFLIANTELLYVDKLLELLMITVPFLAAFQVLSGLMQTHFDKMVYGIAKLLFIVCMSIAAVVFAFIFGDYGTKVSNLMQSMKMEHFYVVLGIIPGILIGALAGIIFFTVIWLTHREQVPLYNKDAEQAKESILELTLELGKSQFSEVVVPCLKHMPVILLLYLSLEEIYAENYLFGNFYGAILPAFGILWTLMDIGLITYKKRLYTAYRKKMHEQFYRDLKTVLCYVLLHSAAIFAFSLALRKSYLAIWNLQTYVSFMELVLYCSVIGLLGLPYIVLGDVLKYRGMQSQYVFSVLAGTVVSAAGSALCVKFLGTGIWLYVICIGLQLFTTIILSSWSISSVVGIHYMSVLIRTAGSIVFTLLIAVLLYGIQYLAFTPLGGIGTLIICIVTGVILQSAAVFAMHVFDKEELGNLPFAFITKYITKIF